MRFGWSAYVIPVLFVFSPSLILIGAPTEIALAVVTAIMGVWLVSAALAGFFSRKMSTGMRLLFALFGLLSLVPAGMFDGAIYSDIVGVIGGIVAMAFEIRSARRDAEVST